MAQGYPIPCRQRLFLADGVTPAVGWKIAYTNAGLGTPVATYSDSGLTSANTDPIVTDANGYYDAYIAAGTVVDEAVTDENDVPQWTRESLDAMKV